jgi:hypothetical protein
LRVYIGVDAGLTGALSGYDPASRDLLFCHDMPTDKVAVNGKERNRLSAIRLLHLLGPWRGSKAIIEHPEIRPMKTRNKQDGSFRERTPGAQGMFSFGEAYGITLAVLVTSGLFVVEVRPYIWMKGMGVGAGKDEKRRIAAQRYPRWADDFMRVKDDGRAESALIAEWASSMDQRGLL